VRRGLTSGLTSGLTTIRELVIGPRLNTAAR
jgi:hypothetical protein